MAFSLKSLFRRESSDPSQTNSTTINGESIRGSMSNEPGQPGPTPFMHGSIVQERHVQPSSSPFKVATALPSTPQPVPMSIASPFQPASEEGFTIRELSILLPPQLLNTANLPPDYLVPLPLEALRATFLAGRPCLRLSQVFAVSPYLFSRQLMPEEDQEVALPYQKVRRILEGNQVALPPVRTAGAESPFSIRQAAPEPASEVLSPIDSPFQAVAPVERSPFEMKPEAPVASPFALVQPSQPAAPAAPLAPAVNSVLPASPFQVAPKFPGAPAPASAAPINVNAPASPFTVAERLPAPTAPLEGPPAFPAPHSSSPFQIVQPAPIPVEPRGLPQPAAGIPASPFAVSAPSPCQDHQRPRPPPLPRPRLPSPCKGTHRFK
jgi:hypothetical protein